MFKVNDYVIYNTMGVYVIVDIRIENDHDDEETEYYVLEPVYGNNLTIKTPVMNPKILMRKILTKDEAMSLIESMPEQETIWIENDKQRGQDFKKALKTCESETWAKLIKTIYLVKQEKSANGKKLMKVDEDIMKAAEKNLYEEFATALDMSPEKVESFIMNHIS